ncbi:MAG: LEA type 2 family protein [Sedimentisphaerales bacterium]|nr:LEA type 2 family protein [Sedimentisphaerales bacterium]
MRSKACFSILLLFGFIPLGCDSVQQALHLQKPTASLKGLSFEEISLTSATLLFDVEIKNPYPAALPLLNMEYGLTSGTRDLLSGRADLATTIPAKDSKTVSLPVKITYLSLVEAFKGIQPGSTIPYRADLGLSVDAPVLGQLALPLKREGQLTVPSIPNLDQIDWKSRVLDTLRK